MFWWLGLPTPLLWGLVMGAARHRAGLGCVHRLDPASIFSTLNGSWEKAIILVLWGGLVVSSIDNFLYPMLVGNRLKLHSVPAFISLVGGLTIFWPGRHHPWAHVASQLQYCSLTSGEHGSRSHKVDNTQPGQPASKPWHCMHRSIASFVILKTELAHLAC